MVPAIFPEMMLLPSWFYLNIYEMSSWTRGIVIPMAILSALRPDWRLPERAQVDELFAILRTRMRRLTGAISLFRGGISSSRWIAR